MHDAHSEAGDKRWTESAMRLGDTELLYADDTLLIGSSHKALEPLLHAIENQPSKYGMKLNMKKCEMISLNTKENVKCKNGEK